MTYFHLQDTNLAICILPKNGAVFFNIQYFLSSSEARDCCTNHNDIVLAWPRAVLSALGVYTM